MDRQFIIQNYRNDGWINVYFFAGLIISSSFAIWLNTKSGQKWIDELLLYIMELYTIFMGLGALIGTCFAIWLNTKSGQKWIDEL